MTTGAALLAVTIACPLVMLLACVSARVRHAMPALLALAPVPAALTALVAADGAVLSFPDALLRLTIVLDLPGRMLLGASALLWMAAGAYASCELRGQPNGGHFAVWWLLTLTGSLGVFIAADMVSFYFFFTLVSLAAYGLIIFDGSTAARRAGAINVSFAVVSEALLLAGFVLLAAGMPEEGLLIRDAVAALPTSPWRAPALVLLVLGFGLKIGLVPLHVWMPLTYAASTTAVAAVLSGAAVKAGVIGLIRFLPLDSALPAWGTALAAVGLLSAFYGVAIGLTQRDPKTVLAYSSISQMGVITTVLGMGLVAGDKSVALAATFYAVHHVLAKGGLFLAIGVASRASSRGLVMLPAAILALGLGGLPLTGGALAKAIVKEPLGDGVVGMLAIASAVASTLLMIHFLRRLASMPRDGDAGSPAAVATWLTTASASIVLPWALYGVVAGGAWQDVLAPEEFWSTAWPVLVGGLLALTLAPWQRLLPRVPEGDVLMLGNSLLRAGCTCGAVACRVDRGLGQWPAAGTALLALTLILIGLLVQP